MAYAEEIIDVFVEPHTGYNVRRYKITDDGTGAFTLEDTSWLDVVDMSYFEAGTDTSHAIYWDGSDVKGTGFTASTTIHLTVRGRN